MAKRKNNIADALNQPVVPEKTSAVSSYTAEEIVTMVDEQANTQAIQDFREQMESDFNLYKLEPYNPGEGLQSYTSPKPKNDFLKIFTGINKASLTWQIAVNDDAPEDERNSANDGEMLLTGIIDSANRKLRKTGEPPIRVGLAWYAVGRGAAAMKCLIYQTDSGNQEIDIRPIDPLHLTWQAGANGLVWANFEYSISPAEALSRYGITINSKDNAIIYDFFDSKINSVVFKSGSGDTVTQFVKEPTPHGLDHVPVWIGFAGGMPTVFTKENEQTFKYRAMPWCCTSRLTYEPFNKNISFLMQQAEKSVAGTLAYFSEDGKKGVASDPFQNWQVIRMKIGESLIPLETPKVPPETGAILSTIDRDQQQSSVPYPAGYGIDPQAHSGAALSMLNDNTRSLFDPFATVVEDGFRWLCEEILHQFRLKGTQYKLQGFNKLGKFFTFEADPSKIKDDWYISVKCEPKLPRDEAGELQMSIAARQPDAQGRPLLSDYTILEKILKLQNPDAEDTRVADQQIRRMIEQMPNIQVRKVAKELLDKGDREGAMELMMSLPAPGGQGTPPNGGGQPQAPPPAAGSPPMAGNTPDNTSQIPQLSTQELEQLAGMISQLQAQGKPIPPEMIAALQQASNMPPPSQPMM